MASKQINQEVSMSDATAAPTATEIRTANAIYNGELPEVITGNRAVHLASTVGFGSLRRLGHKRGAKCGPASCAKVALARDFSRGELQELLVLADDSGSAAAKATAKWVKVALKATDA